MVAAGALRERDVAPRDGGKPPRGVRLRGRLGQRRHRSWPGSGVAWAAGRGRRAGSTPQGHVIDIEPGPPTARGNRIPVSSGRSSRAPSPSAQVVGVEPTPQGGAADPELRCRGGLRPLCLGRAPAHAFPLRVGQRQARYPRGRLAAQLRREVLDVQERPLAHDERVFDRAAQLAYVAGHG